jgi:hypothetical protein
MSPMLLLVFYGEQDEVLLKVCTNFLGICTKKQNDLYKSSLMGAEELGRR